MNWANLLAIIEKLRSPQGCPWDRQQTHTSLKPYLLEEAYELLEAIDQGQAEAIKDELGDLLLQVLLHAQIAKEAGAFSMEDVVSNLSEKMVRRHPHVFAAEKATTPEEVAVHWEDIKKKERASAHRVSALDGVPVVFPALMRAHKIQQKAAKVGFDWVKTEEVVAKIEEELQEVQGALQEKDQEKLQDELGDLLFAVVNLARFTDIQPELALQQATAKFAERFYYLEEYARQNQLALTALSLQEMDVIWEKAKAHLRKKPQA